MDTEANVEFGQRAYSVKIECNSIIIYFYTLSHITKVWILYVKSPTWSYYLILSYVIQLSCIEISSFYHARYFDQKFLNRSKTPNTIIVSHMVQFILFIWILSSSLLYINSFLAQLVTILKLNQKLKLYESRMHNHNSQIS